MFSYWRSTNNYRFKNFLEKSLNCQIFQNIMNIRVAMILQLSTIDVHTIKWLQTFHPKRIFHVGMYSTVSRNFTKIYVFRAKTHR